MFEIQAKSTDALALAKHFGRAVGDQMRFAGILAATETGKLVKSGELKVMARVFDRPTKFTMNSLQLQTATKKNPSAIVRFRDFAAKGTPAAKYLGPQAYGGIREHKRSEKALIAKGFMKSTQFAIPAAGAEIDQFGNMKRSQVIKILSDLKAFGEQGYQANRTGSARSKRKARDSGYFIAKQQGSDPEGVWQRKSFAFGEAIKPVMVFTPGAPRYKIRLPFHKIATNVVAANYDKVFIEAMGRALSTAKP